MGPDGIHHPAVPPWLSFGTARRREIIPATLSEALSRPLLVYPLVSLDISGQRPVSHADASPNEGLIYFIKYYSMPLEVKVNRQLSASLLIWAGLDPGGETLQFSLSACIAKPTASSKGIF